MKKLFDYLKLRRNLAKRMVAIDETMALKDMVDIYAENVCEMNGWKVNVGSGLSMVFCDISLAFLNGYIKALHDNGLELQNGLVRKREIVNDMPIGALRHYDEKIVARANINATEVLRDVLKSLGETSGNINTIVSDFKKALGTNTKKK